MKAALKFLFGTKKVQALCYINDCKYCFSWVPGTKLQWVCTNGQQGYSYWTSCVRATVC